MVSIFIYFNLMLYLFFLFFILSLGLYYFNLGILMEWLIFEMNSLNVELMILIDWISMLFISFIFFISSMIMLYSYMYMSGEKFIERFIYLVILFILSMIFMIISPNVISIMFGWDGLGLVSYCLIIFYQNYSSYNSGMVTVLCNRIGDVGLLMGICLLMMKGSWNLWAMDSGGFLVFMLFLAAITKSAQMPFSVWLPMAMAAPTPVSALVHSSTLVTAGVYLMIRFNKFLMESSFSKILFIIAILTMFMAGVMANVEYDLKKIIALSTLSQLGLMMMILSINFKMIAFYHLLTHAIFKSLLFMCAGVIIHLMFNSQDIRTFGNLNEFIPFTMMSFFISSLALCGFPFLAGFYSKDLIMEIIYNNQINLFMLILIMISLLLTVMYSIRVFYYMYFNSMKFLSYMNINEGGLMNLSMLGLLMMSMLIGSMLNWLFFFDFYIIYLNFNLKILSLEICLMGVILSMFMILGVFLKNFYYFSYFLSSMWFLNYFYMWVYNPFLLMGIKMDEFDKGYLEFSMKKSLNYLINWFSYNVYMYIYSFSLVFICLFLFIILLY